MLKEPVFWLAVFALLVVALFFVYYTVKRRAVERGQSTIRDRGTAGKAEHPKTDQ